MLEQSQVEESPDGHNKNNDRLESLKQRQHGSIAHELVSDTWIGGTESQEGDSAYTDEYDPSLPQQAVVNQQDPLDSAPTDLQQTEQILPKCQLEFNNELFWLFPPFDSSSSGSSESPAFVPLLRSPVKTKTAASHQIAQQQDSLAALPPPLVPATDSEESAELQPTTTSIINPPHNYQIIFPLAYTEQEDLFESELTYLIAELKMAFELQPTGSIGSSGPGTGSGVGMYVEEDAIGANGEESAEGDNKASNAAAAVVGVVESELELVLEFPDLGFSFSEYSTELKAYNLNRLNTLHQAVYLDRLQQQQQQQQPELTNQSETLPPLKILLFQRPSHNAARLNALNLILERVDPNNQWLPQNMIDPDDSIASDEPDSVTVITEIPTSGMIQEEGNEDGDVGVLDQQEDQPEQEAVMAQLENEVGDAIYEATEVVQVSLLDGGGGGGGDVYQEEEGAVYDDVEYYEDHQQPSQREEENGEGDGIQIPVAEDDVLAADGIYQTEYAQAEESGNGEGDVAIEGEYTTEYIQDGGGEAFEGDGLNYPDDEQNGDGEYPEEERYDESGVALDSASGMEVDEYGEYSGSDHQQLEASADEFARGEKRKSPLTLAEGVSSEDQLGDDELQKRQRLE